jgi:DNA-binding NarL/FixJ family response regulator
MRVLIADDHALLRTGVIEFLSGIHSDWSFIQADSLERADVILEGSKIDLLILDLNMPGMRGVASVQRLRADYPDVAIAVLTGAEDRGTILECLGAGVHGYILKSAQSEQLLQAVSTILAGGVYVPPSLTHVVQQAPRGSVPGSSWNSLPAALTGRQLDVLRLLAAGQSTKEIARVLDLGVGTVKVHLAGVYRALGAHSRMEAVVKAGRFQT